MKMRALIRRSNRKGKLKRATFMYNGKKVTVHFGETKGPGASITMANNLCARSFNNRDGSGKLTRNNPLSANYWSRRVLWKCDGKQTRRRK